MLMFFAYCCSLLKPGARTSRVKFITREQLYFFVMSICILLNYGILPMSFMHSFISSKRYETKAIEGKFSCMYLASYLQHNDLPLKTAKTVEYEHTILSHRSATLKPIPKSIESCLSVIGLKYCVQVL